MVWHSSVGSAKNLHTAIHSNRLTADCCNCRCCDVSDAAAGVGGRERRCVTWGVSNEPAKAKEHVVWLTAVNAIAVNVSDAAAGVGDRERSCVTWGVSKGQAQLAQRHAPAGLLQVGCMTCLQHR
jgi:hypothetical protein